MSSPYQRVRAATKRLMNDPTYQPKRRLDRVVYALIVVSVALVGVEFVVEPGSPLLVWAYRVDGVLLALFAIEYLARLWVVEPDLPASLVIGPHERLRYHLAARLVWALRPVNMVDLIALLPIFPFLRSLRVLRLLRLLTRLPSQPIFRYFDPFTAAGQTLRANRILFLFVSAAIALALLLGAGLGFVAEHRDNPQFGSPFDALWWAAVTITSVGYGDKVPLTTGGKLVGMALMFAGFLLLALTAGAVSQTLGKTLLHLREEGLRMSTMVNQIVICGWNGRSLMLLQEFLAMGDAIAGRVVVFAEGKPPDGLPAWVSFVSGDPTQEADVPKISLEAARAVLVVADEREGQTFSDADARTLLTVFTLRAFESKLAGRGIIRTAPVHITAEIFDPDNEPFLRAAGADAVIQTARLGASLLVKSTVIPQSLSSHGLFAAVGEAVQRTVLAPEVQGTFADAAVWLRDERDALVVGFEREGMLSLDPPADTPMRPGDVLVWLGRTTVAPPPAEASFWQLHGQAQT